MQAVVLCAALFVAPLYALSLKVSVTFEMKNLTQGPGPTTARKTFFFLRGGVFWESYFFNKIITIRGGKFLGYFA